jgi:TonB-dependent starch-binding outer membrane protein SusC
MKNVLRKKLANKYFAPKLRYLLLTLVIAVLGLDLNAQSYTLSGIIADEFGQSFPGASLMIKGTTIGTITDFDGKYKLSGVPGGEIELVVSFIGYKTIFRKLNVTQNAEHNFTLYEDVQVIDDVIVIGYGVQKKKLSTGATSQVKGDDLAKMRATNALLAIQGQTSGVNVVSTSGQPGEDIKVTIRGVGTIGNSGPLYIVDGVPTGDIKYLNNSDIESIDVLKDAASATIYGSQSANGVILITTKQGKAGRSQITFDSYYGVQNRAKKIELLDAQQYAKLMNEQYINSGGSFNSMPFDINNLPAYVSAGSANTRWLDQMFVDNAVISNHSLGLSGGSDQGVYSMSLSYTGQEGIVGGEKYSDYKRYGARLNTENNFLGKRLKIGQHLLVSFIKRNGISVGNQYSNTLRSAFNVSPLMPVYDNNGEFFNTDDKTIEDAGGKTYWNNTEANPYASMVYNNNNVHNNQKIIADVYAIIEPIANLKYRTSLSLDNYADDSRNYTPEYRLSIYSFSDYSKASQNMSKGMTLNFDQTLSYDLSIGQHKIDAMLGMWAQKFKGLWMYGENTHLAFYDFEHAWLSNATNEEGNLKKITGAPVESYMLSYFGRLQYNFNETYLFNATFRADGSSRFTQADKWGYFPSFSAGWVISNESFMSSISTVLNFMKIRASWGQVGNQSIDNFQYLAPIKFTQATYNFGDAEGVSQVGSYPSRLANEKLKWETSEQINIGFDSRLLKSNLTVTFDWYKKTTKDWLIVAPILATAGTGAPFINGGNVINQGVELGLSYNKAYKDFSYSVGINTSYNKNGVTEIPTNDGIIHGATNTLYANSSEFYRAESGHPIGYFWGWETKGIFQNTIDVQNYKNANGKIIQPQAKPGDVKYVDQNGDGIIDNHDKVEIGDPNPDFIFGVNFACNYKAFDFMIAANGVAGNQIVQSYRNHTDKYSNYTTAILDRWTGEGTSNTLPRVTNSNVNYLFSDLFIHNGDYLRISNITLGFDIAKVVKIKGLTELRLYGTVQNLYTLTKYSGMDPEVGFGFDNGVTDSFSRGIDLGYYPRPRTILFGVSLIF